MLAKQDRLFVCTMCYPTHTHTHTLRKPRQQKKSVRGFMQTTWRDPLSWNARLHPSRSSVSCPLSFTSWNNLHRGRFLYSCADASHTAAASPPFQKFNILPGVCGFTPIRNWTSAAASEVVRRLFGWPFFFMSICGGVMSWVLRRPDFELMWTRFQFEYQQI